MIRVFLFTAFLSVVSCGRNCPQGRWVLYGSIPLNSCQACKKLHQEARCWRLLFFACALLVIVIPLPPISRKAYLKVQHNPLNPPNYPACGGNPPAPF